MRALRFLAGMALLVIAFGYGLAAGTYHIFPFHPIADLKDRLLGEPTRARELPEEGGVVVLETALQRLLLRYVALPAPTGTEWIEGGAMAGVGSLLYLVDRDGRVTAFDMDRPAPLHVDLPRAPINVEDFTNSRARHSVARAWFRVSGAYAEAVDDSTHVLFVTHNRIEPDVECFTFNISRIDLRRSAGGLEASGPWRTLFTTAPCLELQPGVGYGRYPFAGHISGGRMISYDDRRLLVTVGDFNFDGYLRPAFSMDPTNPYGKYVLVDRESGAWEILASGARNNMGLFRDRRGVIWSTESGPQGGDELNRVTAGANFGWPRTTLGINYESTPWEDNPSQGRHEGFDPPVFAWNPSIVPSNLVRLPPDGERFALWGDDLLLGTLRDQSLHRLRLDPGGRVLYDERIPIGDRIRDLRLLADGKVALLTDVTGWLVLVEDGGGVFEDIDAAIRERLTRLEGYGTLEDAGTLPRERLLAAEMVFARACAGCHTQDGSVSTGPPLADLIGREVGGYPGFRYSHGLESSTERWTALTLRAFLLDPQGSYPGTTMPPVTLSEVEADSLVAYLGRPPLGNR
jgi:cytochrome c2